MANQGPPKKESQAPGWLFDNIAEASKNARSIYFVFLATMAYCALTIMTTPDEKIFFNEPVRLPIVNLEVQFNAFFGLAPFLITFLFIYFQLYLGKLKSLVDELVSTYGKEEKRRIYPWMINFADEESGFSTKGNWLQKLLAKAVRYLQLFIVDVSLWLLFPGVLSLIGWKYLYKQDPVYSYWMAIVPVVGGVLTWFFWEHYEPNGARGFSLRLFTKLTPVVTTAVVATWLFIKVEPTLNGEYFEIDLQGRRFSKDRSLRGARLAGANMERTVLDSIDLRQANLRNATLREASLRGANLSGADLWGANLDSAKLQKARLVNINLNKTKLRGASLRGADLSNATLLGSDLRGADLTNATLNRGSLRHARLEGTDLGQLKLDVLRAMESGSQYFRASPDTSLSDSSVVVIIKKRGFFDTTMNPDASGYANQFELHFEDSVVIDRASNLMWQRSGSGEPIDYRSARAYVDTLNILKYVGFSDWRLPTLEEAMSLMEPNKSEGVYIDPVFDNNNTQRRIWTSDKLTASRAWVVIFNNGYCFYVDVDFIIYHVRAVR